MARVASTDTNQVCRKLIEQRDELEEALRHSQTEFASIVGEVIDSRMGNLQGLLTAALRTHSEPTVRRTKPHFASRDLRDPAKT